MAAIFIILPLPRAGASSYPLGWHVNVIWGVAERSGSSPSLANIEVAFNALGYQLVVRSMTNANGCKVPLVPKRVEHDWRECIGQGTKPGTKVETFNFLKK